MKQSILITAIALSTLLYLFSLWQREPHVDDAWLGEIVYWNVKDGHPRSELMRGVTQQETRNIVHHKLFTLGGTALTLLFGFHLITLKSLSLICYLVFLTTFLFYLRKKGLPLLVPLLLILTNSLIFEFSFVFRPEVMLMAMVFFSWIFLEKVIENEHRFRNAFLCGLFSGLAVATHLNGIFTAAAGAVFFLVFYRKYLLTFIPGFILTACIYFYDFTPEYGAGFWWYQIAHSPFITVSSHSPLGFVLINILEEQMRFFNSPKEISFTALILFSVYLLLKNKVKLNRRKIFYLASVILLMGVFSAHKTSKYMLLYFPLLILILANTVIFLKQQRENLPPWNYKVFIFLIITYLVTNTIFNVNLAMKKYDDQNPSRIVKTYIKGDCSALHIIAPMEYIFGNIQNFGRIHSDLYYTESYAKMNKPLVAEAALFDIDYIFLETKEQPKLGLFSLKKADTLCNYVVIDKTNDIAVLQRIKK